MTSQGFSVYENAITPPTPAAGYRVLYPVADGWKEVDDAGAARYFAKLDADNVSMTVAGAFNVGSATGTLAGGISASGTIRSMDVTIPASGAGVEMAYASSVGYLIVYDRTTPGYKPLVIDGSTLSLNTFSAGAVTIGGGVNVGLATGAAVGNIFVTVNTLGRIDYLSHRNGASNSLVLWQAGGSSQGTVASPQATASGDILLDIRTRGYQATTGAYTGALASIRFITSQSFTSTAQGTEIRFYVVPNGTTTITQAFMLNNDAAGYFAARVGIGGATPTTHVVEINGAYTTSGIALYVNRNVAAASTDSPVVYFRQQHASDDQHTLQLAQAGSGYALFIESGPVRWDGQNSTGAGTPTFANNKPTASSSTATWLKINIGGTNYYIPCWL